MVHGLLQTWKKYLCVPEAQFKNLYGLSIKVVPFYDTTQTTRDWRLEFDSGVGPTCCYYKYCQVYLVTGGLGWSDGYLSSTELLTSTTSRWIMANNLPRSMAGMSGVTLGGLLYMTG